MGDSKYGKYFKLKTPIIFEGIDDIPETTYTHIYIRKPDPYRSQVGDIDFQLEKSEYENLRSDLKAGKIIKGARVFPVEEQNMIELSDPDVDVLSYVVMD